MVHLPSLLELVQLDLPEIALLRVERLHLEVLHGPAHLGVLDRDPGCFDFAAHIIPPKISKGYAPLLGSK
jgi:hypothetical protein